MRRNLMSNLPKSDSKEWIEMSLTDKLDALNNALQPKENKDGIEITEEPIKKRRGRPKR